MLPNNGYVEAPKSNLLNWVAGFTIGNVAILGAIDITGKDGFSKLAAMTPSKGFDICLGASEPFSVNDANGAKQTNMPGLWNYRTMSPCMVTPPIFNPNPCT